MATQLKEQRYSEADLILGLGLERIVEYTSLMQTWLASEPKLLN